MCWTDSLEPNYISEITRPLLDPVTYRRTLLMITQANPEVDQVPLETRMNLPARHQQNAMSYNAFHANPQATKPAFSIWAG